MYENIFFDLADNELLLAHLEYGGSDAKKNSSSSFSFKGKCMVSLLYGHVQINGYSIRNEHQLKWFEAYSPETNAFLAIKGANPMQPR